MLLENKVAIVYGGGGIIGRAVARAFASEGARVFIAGRPRKALRWLPQRSRAWAPSRHRADRAAPLPRRAVRCARADRGARARAALSPPPATSLRPPPGPPARHQPAPAVLVPTAIPGTRGHACRHRAAGELHRGNDAGGLVRPGRMPALPAPGSPHRASSQTRTACRAKTASSPVPHAASIASVA